MANMLATKASILASYPETKLVIVTGPYFSGELPQLDEFLCYASYFEPFLTDYLNVASAIVCMADWRVAAAYTDASRRGSMTTACFVRSQPIRKDACASPSSKNRWNMR